MLNVLITGADGQLGRALRARAAGSGDNYIFTDAAQLDVTDAAAIERCVAANNVDVIVNCAAYTDVERAEVDEAAADMLNNTAAGYLAAAMARVGGLLIHISTDYVFDGQAREPYREGDATNPRSVYGRTKLAGERAIVESGCRYMIIRTSWLYSETGNNFVRKIWRLIAERDRIDVVDDQRGSPTYAADLAAAIVQIVEGRMFEGGIYHYAGGGACSWYEFACEIARLAGSNCSIRPCSSADYPTAVQRPAYSVLYATKFENEFKIAIPQWRQSLAKCIENIASKS